MSYLQLDKKILKNTVQESIRKITRLQLDFDTIAVRGHSGTLMAVPLALKFDCDVIVVRKSSRDSHSGRLVEGYGYDQKILIVDDFVESGRTLKVIKRRIEEYCKNPTIVGAFLYNSKMSFKRPEAF